jgi:hypothetical protein
MYAARVVFANPRLGGMFQLKLRPTEAQSTNEIVDVDYG